MKVIVLYVCASLVGVEIFWREKFGGNVIEKHYGGKFLIVRKSNYIISSTGRAR
jgi:hypothetical protein